MKPSIRFEVFKRDSFRCQYCGAEAPHVVLHVDHVKPVAEGGTDDILNLVTACSGCNLGKGRRPLDDTSALSKQRAQMEELEERRQQLAMMIQWKEDLAGARSDSLERVAEFWSTIAHGYYLNDTGMQALRRLVRRFSHGEVMEAMQAAGDEYIEMKDGKATNESVELAWSKIGGICRVARETVERPYIRELYYIRGILRNRVNLYGPNQPYALQLLEEAYLTGAELGWLRRLASSCRSWADFRDQLEALLRSSSLTNRSRDA